MTISGHTDTLTASAACYVGLSSDDCERSQELISRLDTRTFRLVNLLGLLVFTNNTKNVTSDIKRRIMVCLEISLKLMQFNGPYDFLSVCHCNYSYIVYYFPVI